MILCVDGLEGKEKHDYVQQIHNQFNAHFFAFRDLEQGHFLNQELKLFSEWIIFCHEHSGKSILSNYSPNFSYKHFPQMRELIRLYTDTLYIKHIFIELREYDPGFAHTHLSILNELYRL